MAHKITSLEGDLADLLNKTSIGRTCTGFINVDGYIMPERYEKFAEAIDNFEVRDDDIWVCSYPKTGTTWTQEMVWCIANDLDFEGAKEPIAKRFPYFEISVIVDTTEVIQQNPELELPPSLIDSFSFSENLPSPRFIKSHLPFELLPRQLRTGEKKPKIVYVVRNAKDTCISYYHHNELMYGFGGNLEDFCNLFIGNMVKYTPFWTHALSYWKKRINENVLFLKYEDMKKDLPFIIKKTATFLGKNLTTDQLSILTEHLSFASMKKNPAVNHEGTVALAQKLINSDRTGEFMRSGNDEQWKAVMSPEFIQRFDDWTRESLKGTRLYF